MALCETEKRIQKRSWLTLCVCWVLKVACFLSSTDCFFFKMDVFKDFFRKTHQIVKLSSLVWPDLDTNLKIIRRRH